MSETVTVPEPAPLGMSPRIDELERALVQRFLPIESPVQHRFTPGMYSRECTMFRGSAITSKIHKTEHQFFVSRGKCAVWTENTGWEIIQAPFHGITKPGTRRVLLIIEDTVWTTFHPTNLTDLGEIEHALIEPHDIPKNINEGKPCLGSQSE